VDSDKSPELIEQEMQETRQSLVEKVAALENQVVGTIQSATSAVQETVESVKSVVDETVSTVKETVGEVKEKVEDSVSSVSENVMQMLDIRRQVNKRPWVMVGGAAAAGFLTGLIVFRKDNRTRAGASSQTLFEHASYTPPVHAAAAPLRQFASEAPETASKRSEPKRPNWLDDLLDLAGKEATKLGQMAIASVIASLERNINEGLPKLIDRTLHMTDESQCGSAPRGPNGADAPFSR
jgi:ElaB/YqjD/DUF883 family membrane-anchored ribosome-binding protein